MTMHPATRAALDQAEAAVRDTRADGPVAAAEQRCVAAPTGCGRPIPSLATGFRDQASRDEYDITHLCQTCQDRTWPGPSAEEIAAMAADPDNYERCPVCGEWRELEHVDVGVGVISGHNCCSDERFGDGPRTPDCTRTPGCWFGEGHVHQCEIARVGGAA